MQPQAQATHSDGMPVNAMPTGQRRAQDTRYSFDPTTDSQPPENLPPQCSAFLSNALGLDPQDVDALWGALGGLAWSEEDDTVPDQVIFQQFGVPEGITQHDLYPPTRVCLNPDCPHYGRCGHRARLGKPQPVKATLFTIANGPVPVVATSLYCRDCLRTYHVNYIRYTDQEGNARRMYYDEVPDVLEVELHAYMERGLATLFMLMTLFAAASSESIARIYEYSLAGNTFNPFEKAPRIPWPANWTSSPVLSDQVISDGFGLFSLLRHHNEHSSYLDVPHEGTQRQRLDSAMRERNILTAGPGQEQIGHACSDCRKEVEINGVPTWQDAAVADGVDVTRACCQMHDCQNDLVSNRTHYCHVHADMEDNCRVSGCDQKCTTGFQTCEQSEHRQVEVERGTTSTAFFQLSRRMERADRVRSEGLSNAESDRAVHPMHDTNMDGSGHDSVNPVSADRLTDEARTSLPKAKTLTLRARFSRRRTNNEQLIVRPCGIINSRATFYGSEAVGDVAKMVVLTYPTPQAMPRFLFYDNNCQLHRHVAAHAVVYRGHFDRTKLPVDVFHFKCKHTERDIYCDENCNPRRFDELFDEKGQWRFNSSAAEQVNHWFNSFKAIVREMLPVRYDFFLDEMIKQRNRWMMVELGRKGRTPFDKNTVL